MMDLVYRIWAFQYGALSEKARLYGALLWCKKAWLNEKNFYLVVYIKVLTFGMVDATEYAQLVILLNFLIYSWSFIR